MGRGGVGGRYGAWDEPEDGLEYDNGKEGEGGGGGGTVREAWGEVEGAADAYVGGRGRGGRGERGMDGGGDGTDGVVGMQVLVTLH
jgi:hypothetical protein